MQGLNTPISKSLDFQWEEIETKGTPPPALEYATSAIVGKDIYIFSGRKLSGSTFEQDDEPLESIQMLYIFNTENHEWRNIKVDVPETRRYSDFDLPAISLDNKIWVIEKGMLVFDTQTNTWSTKPMGDTQVGSLEVKDNKIYSYDRKGSIFVYDPSLSSWATLSDGAIGDLPYDRYHTHLMNINGKFLLFEVLGMDVERGYLFYYDPENRAWKRADSGKMEVELPQAEAVGESIHRFGPFVILLNSSWECDKMNNVYILDLRSNSWKHHSITAHLGMRIENSIYVFGCDGTNKMHKLNVLKTLAFEEALSTHIFTETSKFERPLLPKEEEFSSEDILCDSLLPPVNWDDVEIHGKISRNLVDVFVDTGLADPKSIFEHDVPENLFDGKAPTPGQTEYLTLAYANHFSVEITPDIIFYTVLCEISDEIKKNTERYRTIFTDSNEKKSIITLQGDVRFINVQALVDGIVSATPNNIAKLFTVKFSTTTPQSHLALSAALCDAVSPYFDYFGTLCGIPRIKLLGTKEDWELLEESILAWVKVFSSITDQGEILKDYLTRCAEFVHKMRTTKDPKFWSNMFLIDSCQSGHTDMVAGWITQLYKNGGCHTYRGETSYSGDDFYNYESHISIVKYTNLETERKFELYAGLLYSTCTIGGEKERENKIESQFPFLRPKFAHVTREKFSEVSDEDYDKYLSRLKPEDREFLEMARHVMETPVFLNNKKKMNKRQNLPQKLFHIGVNWQKRILLILLKRYLAPLGGLLLFNSNEHYKKLFQELGRLLSLKNGPSEISNMDDAPDASYMWKGLENNESVKTIFDCYFSDRDSILSLSHFLRNPNCLLESLDGNIPDYRNATEDIKEALRELNVSIANTKTPLRICSLLSREDSPIRSLSLSSLRKHYARYFINTLFKYNPPIQTLSACDVLRFFSGQKHNYYDETEKELNSLDNQQLADDNEMISRFASYVSSTPSINYINFRGFNNTEIVFKAIANNNSVKDLYLELENDNPEFLDILFSNSSHSFNKFVVRFNVANPATAVSLAKLIKENNVKSLIAEKVGLQGESANIIAEALSQNTSLESLNLSKNEIGKKEGEIIAKWIESGKAPLKNLNLVRTKISPSDILLSLKDNKTLTTVDLSDIDFTLADKDVDKLVEIIKQNNTLESLKFNSGKRFASPEVMVKIADSLKDNHTLQFFGGPSSPLFSETLTRNTTAKTLAQYSLF